MARERFPRKQYWPWSRESRFQSKQPDDSALKASHRALERLEFGADAPSHASLSVYWPTVQTPPPSGRDMRPGKRSQQQQPLLIEFIGLPGSGKTTLITNSGFSKADVAASAVHSPISRPRPGLSLLRAPFFAGLVFSAAIHRGIYARSALRKCVTVVRRYVELCDVRGAGAAVIDEGPTHALFTLFFGSEPSWLSKPLERRLLALIARQVAYFVYVDVPPEECTARLQTREAPHSRFNSSTAPKLTQALLTDCTYPAIVGPLRQLAAERVKTCNDVESCCYLLQGLASEHSDRLESNSRSINNEFFR